MTPEEIDQMPAGRDMDRAIAEHVFGMDPLNARQGHRKDGDIEYSWGYPVGHDIAPFYSTNIAHAWRIVEQGRRLYSPWFDLGTADKHDGRGVRWGASFDRSRYAWSEGETPELALCRAALKAALKREAERAKD